MVNINLKMYVGNKTNVTIIINYVKYFKSHNINTKTSRFFNARKD